MDWKSLGFYVLDRFKEPSTWVSIGLALAAAHVNLPDGLWAQLSAYGVVSCVTLGVLLKEGKAA